MEKLYIAYVSTPGFFASLIRMALRQDYVHVALSLDPELEECYSIGRRNPEIPILAGFEKEDKERILKKFPHARYRICQVSCTKTQKQAIRKELEQAMEHRFSYHYTILGLPLILLGIPFTQKMHYTCSSYIAKILEEKGIWNWNRHTSIITPKDFLQHGGQKIIFEGRLEEIVYDRGEKECGVKFLYG